MRTAASRFAMMAQSTADGTVPKGIVRERDRILKNRTGGPELARKWDKVSNMKMIGLIGGMSWESSAEYYRIINEGVRDRLGPTASARCLLWSFDFAEIEAMQHMGDLAGSHHTHDRCRTTSRGGRCGRAADLHEHYAPHGG
jgi:aspartate racemase